MALLRRRKDVLAKRVSFGCVYSIQLRPMGTNIRCGGAGPVERGGVSSVRG